MTVPRILGVMGALALLTSACSSARPNDPPLSERQPCPAQLSIPCEMDSNLNYYRLKN